LKERLGLALPCRAEDVGGGSGLESVVRLVGRGRSALVDLNQEGGGLERLGGRDPRQTRTEAVDIVPDLGAKEAAVEASQGCLVRRARVLRRQNVVVAEQVALCVPGLLDIEPGRGHVLGFVVGTESRTKACAVRNTGWVEGKRGVGALQRATMNTKLVVAAVTVRRALGDVPGQDLLGEGRRSEIGRAMLMFWGVRRDVDGQRH